jgi:hypothetical protein
MPGAVAIRVGLLALLAAVLDRAARGRDRMPVEASR